MPASETTADLATETSHCAVQRDTWAMTAGVPTRRQWNTPPEPGQLVQRQQLQWQSLGSADLNHLVFLP
jgi:hypothetical protein